MNTFIIDRGNQGITFVDTDVYAVIVNTLAEMSKHTIIAVAETIDWVDAPWSISFDGYLEICTNVVICDYKQEEYMIPGAKVWEIGKVRSFQTEPRKSVRDIQVGRHLNPLLFEVPIEIAEKLITIQGERLFTPTQQFITSTQEAIDLLRKNQ